LGYDKNALITVDISQIQNRQDVFTNQIREYSGIEDITYGQYLLSSSDTYQMFGIESEWVQVIPVHHTFLKVMGIEVTEGRDFRQDDINSRGALVFNETARKKFNIEPGISGVVGFIPDIKVAGFIPDIKFASFRTAIEPMAFYVSGVNHEEPVNYAYIKLKTGTNLRAAMSHIHSTLAGFDAEYPFEVRFYDEILQRLYEKETALNALITLFSLIAIFISIAGVFGLVVFDSECRRKEIGIRKVLGASVVSIILMFNKIYFRILIICFVLAAPLAWYIVSSWLENFAYKTPMYWWIYLLAFVAVGVITAVTVTFQNRRVAIDDPVNAIKSE
jgi:putative ABC transport system permease protein